MLKYKFQIFILSIIFISSDGNSKEKIYFEARLKGERCSLKFPISAKSAQSYYCYSYDDPSNESDSPLWNSSLEVCPVPKGDLLNFFEKIRLNEMPRTYYSGTEVVDSFYSKHEDVLALDVLSRDEFNFYQSRYIPLHSNLLRLSLCYKIDESVSPGTFDCLENSVLPNGISSNRIDENASYVVGTVGKHLTSIQLTDYDHYALDFHVHKNKVYYSISVQNFDRAKTLIEILKDNLGSGSYLFDPIISMNFHNWQGFEAVDFTVCEVWPSLNYSNGHYRLLVTDKHLYKIRVLNDGNSKINYKKVFDSFKIGY